MKYLHMGIARNEGKKPYQKFLSTFLPPSFLAIFIYKAPYSRSSYHERKLHEVNVNMVCDINHHFINSYVSPFISRWKVDVSDVEVYCFNTRRDWLFLLFVLFVTPCSIVNIKRQLGEENTNCHHNK